MKVAIITGASSGIGEALARELHGRGYAVGLVARRGPLLESLAEELGDGSAWAVADVSDRDALHGAIGGLEEALGPCDLLIANAGIVGPNPGYRFKTDQLQRFVDVNFYGAVHAATAVLPGMIARERGHLAVVSSVASFRGLPKMGPYSATKAAISTLFESWRLDLHRHKIKVTSIHPGYVDTPIHADYQIPKPWMISAEKAARIIVRGLERGKATITFPWQLALVMKLARALPDALYRWYAKYLF